MKLKVLIFTITLIVLYLGSIWTLDKIRIGGESVLGKLTLDDREPGTHLGQSLLRFRDIEDFRDIDILFSGSSHCYRGFDPRIFQKRLLTVFNLGSTSQTALNAYYLLKRYFDQLNPRLVIYEVYFGALVSEDGLESYYDLLNNTPFSFEILEMALAARNPNTFNAMTSTYLDRVFKPLEEVKQKPFKKESYIYGGYCERKDSPKSIKFKKFGDVKIADIQIEYLQKIINYVQERGSEIMLVMHPLPKELLANVSNYREVSGQFNTLAETNNIMYFDFNEFMELETYRHFKDDNHLNAAGVKIFNEALIDTLYQRKYFGPEANLVTRSQK